MEAKKEMDGISVLLTKEESLVLLDWLSNFNEKDNSNFFRDQAEERVLFDLEAVLETKVSEVLRLDYKQELLKAREKVRDK